VLQQRELRGLSARGLPWACAHESWTTFPHAKSSRKSDAGSADVLLAALSALAQAEASTSCALDLGLDLCCFNSSPSLAVFVIMAKRDREGETEEERKARKAAKKAAKAVGVAGATASDDEKVKAERKAKRKAAKKAAKAEAADTTTAAATPAPAATGVDPSEQLPPPMTSFAATPYAPSLVVALSAAFPGPSPIQVGRTCTLAPQRGLVTLLLRTRSSPANSIKVRQKKKALGSLDENTRHFLSNGAKEKNPAHFAPGKMPRRSVLAFALLRTSSHHSVG